MKKKLLSLLLCLSLLLPLLGIPAGAGYTDNENWVKVTEEDAHAMFSNNETFMLMCYNVTCGKCITRGKLMDQWMTEYGQTVYGLCLNEEQIPYWLRGALPSYSVTPIVALVRSDHSGYALTGILSARGIRDMFDELAGIIPKDGADFSQLNAEMAALRPTDDTLIRELYLQEPAARLKGKAVKAYHGGYLKGKSPDSYTDYDKVNAIWSHTCYTCYFSLPLEEDNPGDTCTASSMAYYATPIGNTYGLADYARNLLWDAGFPCRMVKGMVIGNGYNQNVPAVLELYDQYLADGDLETFAQAADPLANHYWLEVWVDGAWIILDPSLGCSNDHYGDHSFIQGARRGPYFDLEKNNADYYNSHYVSWPEQGRGVRWYWDIDYQDTLHLYGGVTDTEAAQTGTAWLGMYDEQGQMLDCAAVTLEDGAFDMTLSRRTYSDALAEVKLFLLGEDLSPVRLPYPSGK